MTVSSINDGRISNKYLLGLILVITLSFYAVSIPYGFISHDDPQYIFQNQHVISPSLVNIFNSATLTVFDWTPIVTISHAIEYKLFGFYTPAFRCTEILLHLTSIVLLFKLFLKLEVPELLALLAVFIFAVHPLNVETVAWMSVRKNILALIFGTLFISAYLDKKWIVASFWMLLALGSKGTSFIFPFMAIALSKDKNWRAMLKPPELVWNVIFISMGLLRICISMISQWEVVNILESIDLSFMERMSITCRVILLQTWQFFFPNNLSFSYIWQSVSWFYPPVWGSFLIICTTLGLLLYLAKDNRRIYIGLVFLVLGYLPTANIVLAPYFQADRYAHISLIGAALIVCELLSLKLLQIKYVATAIMVWYFLILLPFGIKEIRKWRDGETLWTSVLQRNPDDLKSLYRLSQHFLYSGQYDKAQVILEQVLSKDPGHPGAKFNIAVRYESIGQRDKAFKIIERMRRDRPGDPKVETFFNILKDK